MMKYTFKHNPRKLQRKQRCVRISLTF